jgi:hypothetical protein
VRRLLNCPNDILRIEVKNKMMNVLKKAEKMDDEYIEHATNCDQQTEHFSPEY